MPIYEYVCQTCGKVIEILQPMGQNSAGQPCPDCQGENLVKKFSVMYIGKGSHNHGEAGVCCERASSCGCGSGGCRGGH